MKIEDFKSTSDSGFEAPRHLLLYSKCIYVSPRRLPFLPPVPSQVSQVVKRAASTVREREWQIDDGRQIGLSGLSLAPGCSSLVSVGALCPQLSP